MEDYSDLMKIEGYEWLNEYLKGLEQRQRYIFIKRMFYNVKLKTLSKNLKISEERVRQICNQASKKLKELMGEI